jgi:outer membrane protein
MKRMTTYGVVAGTLLISGGVAAQTAPDNVTGPWWVHAGPVGIFFDTHADVKLGGQEVPGAGASLSNNGTFAAEFGYDITRNIAARLTVGVPPTTHVSATGTLASVGGLGKLTYAPAVLSLTWSFDGLGRFRPYVGGGVNYAMILSRGDGALSRFNAKSAFGGVIQAGFDVALTKKWGVFVDVKKIFLKTSASGWAGPLPATASVRLDPLLIQTGVSYRF